MIDKSRGTHPRFSFTDKRGFKMSDSLENMAEVTSEVNQPDEVVATESEETAQPQGGDVETEIVIEAEADQQTAANNGNSQSEAEIHARWLKEREKRKRKNEELQREKDERERIERELNQLRETVSGLTKGAPPTLESCDYDEGLFAKKMQEYYAPPKQESVAQTEQQQKQSSNIGDDAAEFSLHKQELELEKAIPNYADSKTQLVQKFQQYGGGEQNIAHLTKVGYQCGADVAKAFVGLNANPSLVNKLANAYANSNEFAIAEVLKEAQGKVKTQQRKPLDTQPEPNIKSSGPIDNKSAAVQKAREAWANETNPQRQAALWKEYQAAKKQ